MEIHYFQRYHGKENVATSNTMLLISRLYSFSPNKFYRVLGELCFENNFDPDLIIKLQERSVDSVPDAVIRQNSFEIKIETKLSDWFYTDQLKRHLNSFGNVNCKVLMTLAPVSMGKEKQKDFEKELLEYNKTQAVQVSHINCTFKELAEKIEDVLEDRDYEMLDVLNDYMKYCIDDGLIFGTDSWKTLRVQLAGKTFDFNVEQGIYYDGADKGFRPHDYLGLYTNKSVRAIGKISARITAVEENGEIVYFTEYGELTEERKKKIAYAMEDGDKRGYSLRSIKHRYFFVEKFYETDFNKTSLRAPMGSRIFDLQDYIKIDKNTSAEKIAELLKDKTWE